MEKKWLRAFGLCSAITLIGGASLAADDDSVTKVVDVESPIQRGNLIEARQNAQKLAFEKALDEILPASTDVQDRARKLKSASRYVKSFRVTEEKQAGDLLKVKYQIEIDKKSSLENLLVTSADDIAAQAKSEAMIEVIWKPSVSINAGQLWDQLERSGVSLKGMKVSRTSALFRFQSSKSTESLLAELNSFLNGRASARIFQGPNAGSVNVPAAEVPPQTP